MLLAIDTSTRYAGVCLRDQNRVVCSLSWYSTQNHTKDLLPAIESVLGRLGTGTSALDAIAVAAGPGGFSALRVGMSAAKGLAMPTGLPVVSVGTLECEAYPYAPTGLPVCPLLDVGRGEVATARFHGGDAWVQTADEWICAPEDIGRLGGEEAGMDGAGMVVLCGEGVTGREEQLREALGERALIVGGNPVDRLWALAELGWRKLEAGETADLATFQPFYLRRPTIGRPAAPRVVNS